MVVYQANSRFYQVPVLIPRSVVEGDLAFEIVKVNLFKLPNSASQSVVNVRVRVAVVEGVLFLTPDHNKVEPGSVILYTVSPPSQYHNFVEGEDEDTRIDIYKLESVTAQRVAKAMYLFGYITASQKALAKTEMLRLVTLARAKQRETELEGELINLVHNPHLGLVKAKKLIDSQVKQAKLTASK
jgi:hypothetical protein